MRLLTRSLAAIAISAGCTSAFAAPVYLQDYEAPGGLDEPFNLPPDHSGSSEGILDEDAPNAAGSSTIALDAADGVLGTSQSAVLNIVDEGPDPIPPATTPPTDSTGVGGSAYHIRLVPNNAAGVSGANPAFATDGYVGFYLKADPSAAAAMLEVAPLLEDAGGTLAGSGGVLRQVIADGQWHRYQWNMDDPNDFPNTFETFYGGTPAAETLDATASFDSIAIISRGTNGESSAVLKIDQIGYDNAGELPIPEPSATAIAGLALFGFVARRKRSRV